MNSVNNSNIVNKVGIMGGTFNPIHNGHVSLAKYAYSQYELNRVLFMPTKKPPHKRFEYIAEEHHRVNMVKLAIEEISYFKFSDFELRRPGTTYTYETLTALKKLYKDTIFYFIIGADSLFHIEQWYESDKIMDMTELLVSGRHSYGADEIKEQIDYLTSKYHASIRFIQMPDIPIASKEIRKAMADKELSKDIIKYMDAKVLKYMMDNNLYIKDGE